MIRALAIGVTCALLSSALSGRAWEGDENPAIFFSNDRGIFGQGVAKSPLAGRAVAARLISLAVAQKIGPDWVPEGLKIAKIESGYRCDARNPRSGATGLGQLMFGSAEILEPGSGARRTDCATGARLLALHMERCLTAGATTPALMERCHLSGWHNFGRRLNRRAERYVAKYQRMVKRARPIQVADASGWLVRGTVGLWR